MRTAIVLFNRDLRVHDHPALAAAAKAERIVPLFVLDEAILRSRFAAPNRVAFMLACLRDLDRSLKARGARLFVRRGEVVTETMRVAREVDAWGIHVSADHSAYARRREARLALACERARLAFHAHPGVTLLPPGDLAPAAGDHYRVFGPYHRAWSAQARRPLLGPPRELAIPARIAAGRPPPERELLRAAASRRLPPGGEAEARRRMLSFLRDGVSGYEARHDDLAADATSRLSPYLRFGCVSALELAERAQRRPDGGAFVRQLCWRDFHHQVLAAFPSYPRRDYRHRGDRWSRSQRTLSAWAQGLTGYPIVDAGMRQLAREGYMHNRARLITASFLTKDLYLDWRRGAWHFWDLLVDGEIANNAGNWQWVAGTGNDRRPNRVLNPLRQAERFDPQGEYVRRYLPELEAVAGRAVHRPWKLDPGTRRQLHYPDPIVDHAEAVAELQARRAG